MSDVSKIPSAGAAALQDETWSVDEAPQALLHPATRLRRAHRYGKEKLLAWAFASPALLLLLLFLVIPFFMAIYFSLTNQRLVPGPLPTQYIGIQNFVRLWLDDIFHHALLNNLLFVVIIVPAQGGLALGLALLVNQKIKGATLFRTLYFSPVVTPLAVIAVVWTFLYDPDSGLLNTFIEAISFGHLGPYQWLNDPHLALPAIMLMSIWQGVGFQMIIFLAGLQHIPEELYDAARIDGAGRWQRFVSITIPLLRNATTFVVVITTILAFRLFTQVQVMTQGGPQNATITMIYYMINQGFGNLRVGYASAIGLIFFLIVLVVSLLQRLVLREER